MEAIHIGLTYPDLMDFIPPGELGAMAKQWGYHTLWVTDHALKARLDPFVLLAAVSQRTTRLRLGIGVLALPYRTPYLTAKAAASVDVLSGGRLDLGLGVGDLFHEFEALELDRRVRGRLSDERLEIIRRLLTEESVSFHGRFHAIDELTLLPRPMQAPSVPIWLGGHWNDGFVEAVLRRVGRFADAFLPTWTPVAGYRDTQSAIMRHAEEAGRNAAEIRWGVQLWTCVGDSTETGRRVGTRFLKERFIIDHVDDEGSVAMGSAADCIEVIERYAALGVTEFNLSAVCPPAEMAEQYGRIAEEVLPRFARA